MRTAPQSISAPQFWYHHLECNAMCFRLLFSSNVVSKFEHTPTFHSPEINSSVLDWTRIQMHNKAVPRDPSKIGIPLLTSLTTVQTLIQTTIRPINSISLFILSRNALPY